MRKMFLLRGAPGSGKSTWCRENALGDYVIEPDAIRLMLRAPVLGPDGTYSISQKDNKKVWELVHQLVEDRMATGEMIVIDATFAKTRDMQVYKTLAAANRYRVYVVDFTGIPMETALARNAERLPEYKRVPDYVIERFYESVKTQEIPGYCHVLSPDEAIRLIHEIEPLDRTGYKASNFVGDVHGCFTALCELLCDELGCEKDESGVPVLRDDELYVFVGDYIDRGIENDKALSFIMDAACRDNVVVLEGNHEHWLEKWSHDKEIHSAQFREKTAPQLEEAGVSKKDVSRFYRKCLPFAYFTVADGNSETGASDVFCCHGGLSKLPCPFAAISVAQCIKGSGGYPDTEESDGMWEFSEGMVNGTYLVHGHRGHANGTVHPSEHVFSLEAKVEFGGFLAAARFEQGCAPREVLVENHVYEHAHEDLDPASASVSEAVAAIRKNRFIKEKELHGKHSGISSFNFTRDAFAQGAWNAQTVKARGLFVDVGHGEDNARVVARSYDKFFSVGEKDETQLEELCRSFDFPVTAYVKENGYLGIASAIIGENGHPELFCTSKSTNEGWFAKRFGELLREVLVEAGGYENVQNFARTLHHLNASATFEVIDVENDLHIVEYDKTHIVMLSLVKNSMAFEELPYPKAAEVAGKYGLAIKRRAFVLNTPEELATWHEKVTAAEYELDGEKIEGFVLTDSSGNMAKVKGTWYNRWKSARGMVHDVFKSGRSDRVLLMAERGGWTVQEAEEFYAWLKGYIREYRAENGRTAEEPHVIKVRKAWESRTAN